MQTATAKIKTTRPDGKIPCRVFEEINAMLRIGITKTRITFFFGNYLYVIDFERDGANEKIFEDIC